MQCLFEKKISNLRKRIGSDGGNEGTGDSSKFQTVQTIGTERKETKIPPGLENIFFRLEVAVSSSPSDKFEKGIKFHLVRNPWRNDTSRGKEKAGKKI